MSDQIDNLTLHRLDLIHRQNSRILELLDRLTDGVGNLKVRMSAVETGLAGVNSRIDRVEIRLDRIERRLDLADAPAP